MHSVLLSTNRLKSIIWLGTAVIYGLGVLHFKLAYLHGWNANGEIRAINLDAEAALPAWYASILLFIAGLLFFAIGLAEGRESRTRFHWLFLGSLLVYMSADESAALHEQSADLADNIGVPAGAFADQPFQWLAFGVPAVLLVALIALPFLRRIDPRTARRLMAAGAVYVGGAVVMEFLGSAEQAAFYGQSLMAWTSILVEEGMELLGLTLLVTTALAHLARHHPVLALHLASPTHEQDSPSPKSVRVGDTPAQ